MTPNVADLQRSIDRLLEYLDPHWKFVNCHMVNYLTDNHWLQFVPDAVRAELRSDIDINLAIEKLFWHTECDSQQFPALSKFLAAAERQRLKCCSELLTTVEQVEELLAASTDTQQLSIREFMSAKKCHEVELTAALVNKLVQSSSAAANCYIVDAGDGKGYLSSRLALQFGHRVLGIDANISNTENALTRNRKLQRAWNGLTERADLESQGIKPARRGKKQKSEVDKSIITPPPDNYKTTSRFITTELKLTALIEEHFEQAQAARNSPQICLTGLHTCGNLAATCLQVFHAQQECRILCNVGCCYHLLRERYSQHEFFGNKALMEQQTDYGFPLSNYLQSRQLRLGRNARMLAAQSMERTIAAKELPNITLYYRSLLELLVCRHAPHLKNELQVGKVRKFNGFVEYVQKCADKISAPWLAAVDEEELQLLEQQYELDRHYLSLFYLLRMSFGPVLEKLILLDRLLYLKELGYRHSHLVDLFDPVISPRHYAIVAIKP
ncbi:methyltransferase-like protein 25 [Drosophila grimshawi]|uniref:GH22793 n=1 Tax=Drosophila grimshawi TaxID=7222 RepID=B4JW73_DROGR|nr:methyltransferase-like protein 25 [Drosophila grimshawi]EDV98211.1 GH22793 [Drosophila grimshawi]